MKMVLINKSKFSEMNDKRYYFPDGILSLAFSHPLLNKTREMKINK